MVDTTFHQDRADGFSNVQNMWSLPAGMLKEGQSMSVICSNTRWNSLTKKHDHHIVVIHG